MIGLRKEHIMDEKWKKDKNTGFGMEEEEDKVGEEETEGE
jgi:hypothetical protein